MLQVKINCKKVNTVDIKLCWNYIEAQTISMKDRIHLFVTEINVPQFFLVLFNKNRVNSVQIQWWEVKFNTIIIPFQ